MMVKTKGEVKLEKNQFATDENEKMLFRTKRAADCVAAEKTWVLVLERKIYSNILMSAIQPELEKKLSVLMVI